MRCLCHSHSTIVQRTKLLLVVGSFWQSLTALFRHPLGLPIPHPGRFNGTILFDRSLWRDETGISSTA
jgi:hypothetical protein